MISTEDNTMRWNKALPLILLLSILAGACTWVRTAPGADEVVLLPERRVQDCERMSSVEVSVLARVAGLDRHEEEIEKDLRALARNHAAERGADTIVAISAIQDGKQRYGLYRCEQADPAESREDGNDNEEEGVTVRGYDG